MWFLERRQPICPRRQSRRQATGRWIIPASFLALMVVGAVFDQAFRKFAEAFEARARQDYGTPARV